MTNSPSVSTGANRQPVSVWSCGGGTQSAAIAVLIARGELRPDLSVIVDTEREKGATWAYLDAVIAPALRVLSVDVHRVPKSEYATVDLFGTNGDLLLPAYTASGGKMKGFCSNEWKQRVVRRWLRGRWVEQAEIWIGYSTDERKRVKAPDVQWLTHRFPLIERGLSRADCVRLVEAHGWPTPPRSACWMCPHMTNREWRDLRETAPEDFAKAVRLDLLIREDDSNAFLHRSGTPLALADLGVDDPQQVLGCDGGDCFV